MKAGYLQRVCLGLAALTAGWLLASCYTVPQTGRSSFNMVGTDTEARLGTSAFNDLKKHEAISSNATEIAMVERVGKRIAETAGPDIVNAKWEFVLFDNKEPNAFALPGGKVGVNTGILAITQDDAGLAAVLGHEVAHVSARHGGERMSEQLALAGLATGLAIGLEGESTRTRELSLLAFGIVGTTAAVLPHSRMQESEADRIGLIYMAKAGYNPQEAVAFWQRFRDYNQKKGGKPPAFLSTHPTDERRIADLKKLLPQAEVYYKASGKLDESR